VANYDTQLAAQHKRKMYAAAAGGVLALGLGTCAVAHALGSKHPALWGAGVGLGVPAGAFALFITFGYSKE
jgi:hypothetical protein